VYFGTFEISKREFGRLGRWEIDEMPRKCSICRDGEPLISSVRTLLGMKRSFRYVARLLGRSHSAIWRHHAGKHAAITESYCAQDEYLRHIQRESRQNR
jgi:hypothetical protein